MTLWDSLDVIKSINFAYYGFLPLVLVPISLLLWRFFWRRSHSFIQVAHVGNVKNRKLWGFVAELHRILVGIAMVLIVLALSRPQIPIEKTIQPKPGINILFLIDVSGSMTLEDLKPNRITVALQTAKEIIKKRPNDRFGIVVFAQDAFMLAPVSFDHDFILRYLLEVNTDMLPKEGSALGNAIGLGIAYLQELDGNGAMILLSDGAANEGRIDPLSAAKVANEYDLPVSVVCIAHQDSQTIKDYPIDIALLEEVASASGGRFAFVNQELRDLNAALDVIPTTESKARKTIEIQELYKIPIGGAIGLLILAGILILLGIHNPLDN